MRVNVNQLRVFYLAAWHKSMTKAAHVLYVSTPAVTMQIKKLESWLGFPVFERSPNELRLTERGQRLYTSVEPLFAHLDDIERYIQELMQAVEVEVRLGTHHLPGNYFISDLIAYVQTTYPNLKVRIELGTQDALLEKLFQQELDLAVIIGDMPEEKQCRTVPLFDEDLLLVTATESTLGKIGSLSIKELNAIPLILQQRGTGVRRNVLDFLREHDIHPPILQDNLSSDVIKQFLHKMPAAAFISRFIVQKELDAGSLHEIRVVEGVPPTQFYLAYSNSTHLPVKIKHFLAGIVGFTPDFHRRKLDLHGRKPA